MDEFSSDTDDESTYSCGTRDFLPSLEIRLRELLTVARGRPPSDDIEYVKRRVLRRDPKNPGFAAKVAQFFESV